MSAIYDIIEESNIDLWLFLLPAIKSKNDQLCEYIISSKKFIRFTDLSEKGKISLCDDIKQFEIDIKYIYSFSQLRDLYDWFSSSSC